MSVHFDLPPELEAQLRNRLKDLDALAKEAVLVELYRRQSISRQELTRSLGLSRYETDGVLKRHQVTEDLLSLAEVQEDIALARPDDPA